MAIPILPILTAIPAAASIIHDVFGDRPASDAQKVLELLELAEGRLDEMQRQLLDYDKKLREMRTQLFIAEQKRIVAEERLAEVEKR